MALANLHRLPSLLFTLLRLSIAVNSRCVAFSAFIAGAVYGGAAPPTTPPRISRKLSAPERHASCVNATFTTHGSIWSSLQSGELSFQGGQDSYRNDEPGNEQGNRKPVLAGDGPCGDRKSNSEQKKLQLHHMTRQACGLPAILTGRWPVIPDSSTCKEFVRERNAGAATVWALECHKGSPIVRVT